MTNRPVSKTTWILLLVGVFLFRFMLLLRGPAAGMYNTDEMIMLWSTVGLLFNATATQLVWPATIVQLLAFPVVLIDLMLHFVLPALGGGIESALLAIQRFIGSVGFDPAPLTFTLRTWTLFLSTALLAFSIKPARKLLGEIPALLVVAFMGVSPLVIEESLMFKADGIAVSLFLPLLLWTLYIVHSKPRGWDLRLIRIMAAFAAVLSARLNYLPFLVVPPVILFLLHKRESNAREGAVLRPVTALLVMICGFLLVMLALFPQMWTQSVTFAKTFFGNYLVFKSGKAPDHLLLFKYSPRWFGSLMLPVMLYGMYRAYRRLDRTVFWVLVGSLALMLIPIVTANFYFDRHTLQIVPMLLVFSVIGLDDLARRLPRFVGALLIALPLLFALSHTVLLLEENRATPLEGISVWIDENLSEEEAVALPFYSIGRNTLIPDSLSAVEMDQAFNEEMMDAVMNRVQFHFGALQPDEEYALAPFALRVFGEDEMIQQVRYRAMAAIALAGNTPALGRRVYYYANRDSDFVPPGVLFRDEAQALYENGMIRAVILPPDEPDWPQFADAMALWPLGKSETWRLVVRAEPTDDKPAGINE